MNMENSADKDRISVLPGRLLHHILCFLPQEEAVQTCVLSKSWRNLGSTRPKLEFVCEDYHDDDQTYFLSILDKTLQRYQDQKLCFQEFHVQLRCTYNPESVSFLEKWFPFIVTAMGGVKDLDLSFRWAAPLYFDLPSEVFENSKSLQNLRLSGFKFSTNLPTDKIQLKHLQTLTLKNVHIVDETFQNIMSNCHHIEHVFLSRCLGLTTIRLMNNFCLKRIKLYDFCEEDLCFIGVPNLESMKIDWCKSWFNFDHHRNMHFPGLKTLHLSNLRLATRRPSLDILLRDFPCLQHLYIEECKGFDELRVSNRSIEHLAITRLIKSIKVVVDAPNLEVLDYRSKLPTNISVATTPNKCVSNIKPFKIDVNSEDDFLELSKLLRAVSQSKIYLQLPPVCMFRYDPRNENDYHDICGSGYDDKPVPVEYLHLDIYHGYFYSKNFLKRMFHFCRPRNILERECTKRSRFLCEMFLFRQSKGFPFFYWQQDLEEASMQVWDQNSEEWHSVEGTAFLESGAADRSPSYKKNYKTKHYEVWFKLKWREEKY